MRCCSLSHSQAPRPKTNSAVVCRFQSAVRAGGVCLIAVARSRRQCPQLCKNRHLLHFSRWIQQSLSMRRPRQRRRRPIIMLPRMWPRMYRRLHRRPWRHHHHHTRRHLRLHLHVSQPRLKRCSRKQQQLKMQKCAKAQQASRAHRASGAKRRLLRLRHPLLLSHRATRMRRTGRRMGKRTPQAAQQRKRLPPRRQCQTRCCGSRGRRRPNSRRCWRAQ